MNKTINESHIKIIKDAIVNKNLAIFVGSGISRCTDPEKYPLWNEICNQLKEELGTYETDFLKIAQLYQLEFKAIKTKKKIRSFFPDVDIPCEIQRKILDIEPHYLLTTNWDKLFDNEINNNADIYDIIVDDRSLVESTNDCKYIKIHGDFDHNNFVFTEEDYLNYSNRFPIIENYIKSILTTHVILFLGYSFSDIDLKQIETWIQNNTDVSPQMYLTKFSTDINETEVKYLEKFRITVLPIDISENTEVSKKDGINKFLDILLGTQNNIITESPESYIYNKLKGLSQFPVILRRQIQEHLTNCGFEYDQYSRAILVFYKNILTTDFDKSKRTLYEAFVKNLPEENQKISPTLEKIICILKKADIHGIMRNDKDDLDNEFYYSFDGNDDIYTMNNYIRENSIFDFNLDTELKDNPSAEVLLQNIAKLSLLGKFEDAFIKNKDVLKSCKKNKDYRNMFISMFNYNFLLNKLKTSLDREKYENYKSVNLEVEFYKLPKKTQMNIKDVMEFINFNYIYREIVSVNQSLNKVIEAANVVKNGGFSYSNDSYKYPSNHKNLIDYVLQNNILIETYVEYTEICKNYLVIALNRQSINTKYSFNKYELYTAIKYFSYKDLSQLFDTNFQLKKPKIIFLSDEVLDWLLNKVFINCIKYYNQTNRIDSSFERYITNIIFICSMTSLPKEYMILFLENLGTFIETSRNTLSTFASINSFFGIQYKIVKNKEISSEIIIEILNKIIDKFIAGQCNTYEYSVLSENRIYNLFGYINNTHVEYSDDKRLKELISTIEKLQQKEKIDFCMNLLFQLYRIANDTVKSLIKEYVVQKQFIEFDNNNANYINLFMLNLSLQLLQIIEIPNQLISDFQQFLETYPKNTFDWHFYQIQKQLSFLIKDDRRFQSCKTLIDKIIDNKKHDFLIPSQL